jgi:membrane-associated PAP2 superfamily phosphatase
MKSWITEDINDTIFSIATTLIALLWETVINRGIGLFLIDRKTKFWAMLVGTIILTIILIRIKKGLIHYKISESEQKKVDN